MNDLRDLYQEVILDHGRRPRNFRAQDPPALRLEGHNPLCGDRIEVFLTMQDGVVRDVSFQGTGCAISQASASVMTEICKGKTRDEIEELFQSFHGLVTGDDETISRAESLGKLAVFAGVCEFPTRVKCAILGWHTLRGLLEGERESVSTE